jgi:hypothetical protein
MRGVIVAAAVAALLVSLCTVGCSSKGSKGIAGGLTVEEAQAKSAAARATGDASVKAMKATGKKSSPEALGNSVK